MFRKEGGAFSGVAAACLLAALAPFWLSAAELVGKVTKVSDGDTIWLTETNRVRSKIRLNRIDAPETDQPWGEESAKALSKLIYGKSVRVEYAERDQYGRILGVIYLNAADTNTPPLDVNLEMVRTGNAWHYSHYDHTPAYERAHAEAREGKLGLWSRPHPINPYLWRCSHRRR